MERPAANCATPLDLDSIDGRGPVYLPGRPLPTLRPGERLKVRTNVVGG
jgi:hypothetical protein